MRIPTHRVSVLSTVKALSLGLLLCFVAYPLHAKPREVWERYRIAIIAEDGEAPEIKAIEAGARAEALPLEDEYYLAITIENLSPIQADATACKEALHRAFLENYDGVIASVSSESIAEEIAFLRQHGIPVVLVGQDLPSSQRIGAVINNDLEMGQLAAEILIKTLPYKRDKIAILAGKQDSAVSTDRLSAAREVINQAPKIDIFEPVAYTNGRTHDARQAIERVLSEDYAKDVYGFLILGNWPLLTGQPLPWEPRERFCVACDALPTMVPYIASGQVQAAISRDYFAIGEQSLNMLIEHIHNDKAPEPALRLVSPYIVDRYNLSEFQKNWTLWLQQ